MAKLQRNRRSIGLFLSVVMLCAQAVVAQHGTVHFVEDTHIGLAQPFGQNAPADHPAPQHKGKICPICLFSRALSLTTLFATLTLPVPDFAAVFAVPVREAAEARRNILPLGARAPPPSFLS